MLDISVLYPVPLCALVFLLVRKWRKPTLQYPPSPKGYPIIGNVLDLPMNVPLWESFVSLANRQGRYRGHFGRRGDADTALQRYRHPLLATAGYRHGRFEQQ